MAGCNRWVGGRRRSKQEVIITLPAAALHLLTTWTDWKKFSNKLNINRCSSPQAQTHTHVGFFFLFKPHASLFVSYLFFFLFFLSGDYFWVLQKEEISKITSVHSDDATELRMGKSIQNRRTQVQNECAYVGGVSVCACVSVYVYAFMAICLYASACDWVRVHFCLRETLTAWRLCSKVQTGKQMALLSVT